MINNLPEYWFIDNQYPEVREYLSKTKGINPKEWTSYTFIGYDGCSSYNGVHGVGWKDDFYNNAVEITYEHFLQYISNNNYEIY